MMEHGFSQLPVLDGEKCVGCISEKAILRQVASARDLSQVSQKLVEEIMEEAPPQIDENAPIPLISSLLHFYPAVDASTRHFVVGCV